MPGCHFTYYIGGSFEADIGVCQAIPTLGASAEATLSSLGGALVAIFASSLTAETTMEGSVGGSASTSTLRRRLAHTIDGNQLVCAGPHRTPDTGLHIPKMV